jgi:hypothetical protein
MGVMKRGRTLAAGLVVGALIGTGVAAVTPAGAAVKSAAAGIDWKQVWRTEIKPRAKKTFYTKRQSNQTYVKKTDLPSALAPYVTSASLAAQLAGYYTKPQVDAALGNYYTKAQSDANYYTKAQIDAKLAPFVNSVSAFSGGDQDEPLSATDEVVRSVSLLPPRNGTVLVASSGFFRADSANTVGRCSITTGTTLDTTAHQIVTMPTIGEFDSVAGTRGFTVTQGNLLTVNLVCDLFSGTGVVEDTALTAIFAPN